MPDPLALLPGHLAGNVGHVDVGEPIPDVAFVTTDGRHVRLSEFRGEAMVMVFMRHLG